MATSLELRKRFIDILAGEVGKTEKGENTGPDIIKYQRATTLAGTGWAWCAAFVCWGIREWTKDKEVQEALKLTDKKLAEWLPKTAAAFGFHGWAERNGLLVMDDNPRHVLHTGDLMTFDMSHIGVVTTDDSAAGLVYTIEGNTNAVGGRDGQGVWKKVRRRSEAFKFIRIIP